MEIEIARKMDEEKMKLSEKISSEYSEKFKTQQLEFEKKNKDMQDALEDAKRRGEARNLFLTTSFSLHPFS